MNNTDNSERWRAVPGFEGLYEVSDRGRVRSGLRQSNISAIQLRKIWRHV